MRTRRALASERGSATVWGLGAIAVVAVLTVLVMSMASAVVTRHRAEAAADLGALAAASRAETAAARPCAAARDVAQHMAVRLARCRMAGADAIVEVSLRPGGLLAAFGTASARARAGPAAELPSPVG
jgi:secretion/DNA translocation related TadE-like protein